MTRTPDRPPDRLTVGRIIRPHGLRGEVTVEVLSDAPDRFTPGACLTLTDPDSTPGVTPEPTREREVTIAAVRQSQGRLLVRFTELDGRDAVEDLRGMLLTIPAGAARPLNPDEYWPHQLIGLTVRDHTGTARGVVFDVLPGAAHDLLQIDRPEGGRVLVPCVAALVSVDLDDRTVTVAPVAGLLDPEDQEG